VTKCVVKVCETVAIGKSMTDQMSFQGCGWGSCWVHYTAAAAQREAALNELNARQREVLTCAARQAEDRRVVLCNTLALVAPSPGRGGGELGGRG